MKTDSTPQTGETQARAQSSAKTSPRAKAKEVAGRAAEMAGQAKAKLQEASPQVKQAMDRLVAAEQRALREARERAEPVTTFVRKHRRVLTMVAVAAGVGAAAYIALRRYPDAPRRARDLSGDLVKGLLATAAVGAAVDSARSAGRSVKRRMPTLDDLREMRDFRFGPRHSRALEHQLARLRGAPERVRSALRF
jgi:ElaB/YqjD/DUF883 family membrane-anchored ribosome-binding protein